MTVSQEFFSTFKRTLFVSSKAANISNHEATLNQHWINIGRKSNDLEATHPKASKPYAFNRFANTSKPHKSIGLDLVPWGTPPITRSFIRLSWRNWTMCVETGGRGMVVISHFTGIYWIYRALQWTMFSRNQVVCLWILKMGLSEKHPGNTQKPSGSPNSVATLKGFLR